MITKEELLNEIRKISRENNGIPPGRDRFKKETGVTDWELNKYWPRFGDAQREAGFEPNTLNTGFTDEFLIEKYTALIKELGKIPVMGDLRVKHHNDKGFPDGKVFYRFGTKSQLMNKILEHAEKEGYQDIVILCSSEIEKLNQGNSSETSHDTIETGFVYLARSGRFYKIGRTNSVGRRHHEITILLPENLTIIHEVKTDDPSGVENYWHRRFEQKRKQGEWFDLNSSDVKAFKRWKRIA